MFDPFADRVGKAYMQNKSTSAASLLWLRQHLHTEMKEVCTLSGAAIAHWQYVGLAVLLDAASWIQFSSEENFSDRGDFFPWS